ncbi:ribosome small subunit-dependent GTPase A [Collinsella sp. An2]|uniref:ribosome small subunit-dependent GTPase A n=1 Tax=Collinsella sp. An2 TaxID=1965585 RepID=UPI000B398519|nr:ribosome small subunit-dependent GTPase A [Collinsella sp. An2]OUP07439.1 ribosome small subunit-dependent GTPase A [Collinsella sp. An2]
MGKRTRGHGGAKTGGRRHRAARTSGAGAASAAALPAIEALSDVPAFTDFRLDDAQLEAFEAYRTSSETPDELQIGCVVRLDRGFPLVVTADALFRAEHAVGFAKQNKEKGDGVLPAVGDRVAVRRAPGHDMGVIECVLPRRTAFERWRGKNRGERQVLCANVDTILIVQALGAGEVLLGRIARSLVLARDCGASPVVVLTKADRCDAEELARERDRVERLVGEGVPIIVTSSAEGIGLDGVRAAVPAGTCAMILGESGAGKSTLLNALLGHDALATGAVRERDDAGRHTTVARVMVALPGDAGVIADAPGLRSLPLVGHERGLARSFPEIVRAAHGCYFSDCTHTHEPGCAVREAVQEGEIDQVRLDAFLALAEEMRVSAQSLDPDVHL